VTCGPKFGESTHLRRAPASWLEAWVTDGLRSEWPQRNRIWWPPAAIITCSRPSIYSHGHILNCLLVIYTRPNVRLIFTDFQNCFIARKTITSNETHFPPHKHVADNSEKSKIEICHKLHCFDKKSNYKLRKISAESWICSWAFLWPWPCDLVTCDLDLWIHHFETQSCRLPILCRTALFYCASLLSYKFYILTFPFFFTLHFHTLYLTFIIFSVHLSISPALFFSLLYYIFFYN